MTIVAKCHGRYRVREGSEADLRKWSQKKRSLGAVFQPPSRLAPHSGRFVIARVQTFGMGTIGVTSEGM